MLSKTKIILLLFFTTSAFASKHNPSFGKAEGCKVETKEIEKITKTFLQCGKLKFSQDQSLMDDRFLRWGTYKTKSDTYVTLILSNGVHGERVIVFSKNKAAQIKDIPSSWPVEVKEKKGVKYIEYKKDSDPDGNYRSHFFRFE